MEKSEVVGGELVERGVGPSDRLVEVCADPLVMEAVGQRVMEGETLKGIARSWQVPVAGFVGWVMGEDERRGVYEAALRVRADELAHEALAVADAEGGEVARDRLRVGTRLKLAGLWDRARYGEGGGAGGGGVRVVVVRFPERVGDAPEVTEISETGNAAGNAAGTAKE